MPSTDPPPSGRYLPGALLSGKYRLDELLGEGGMGSVWRATNLLLDLPVAIKLIRADLDRETLRERLQLEARSAAKLGHPAIVRVFDVGESEFGDPFIVMEMLQGETLAHLLTRGRLSGAQAVQLLLPIIDALGTAHSRGIVHRDLKPDNVMIALEDQHVQPKVLDFGIAKLTDPETSRDHKLTEAGAVVGSPDYMSPEQARGLADVDATTDIWSICVVLYEAVTGLAPFTATNYHALLRMIVEDQPKSIVEHAAGDEGLWAIIARGLSKDRRDRYPSMQELGRALAAWLVNHGIREDAAGASVESKWLGRTSDASGLTPTRGPSTHPAFALKVTQESHPGVTGVGRGPFTATVPPHSSGSKRVIGALALALVGALLAFGVLALRQPGRERAAATTPTLNANLRSALTAAEPERILAVEPPTPAAPASAKAGSVEPVVASATPEAKPPAAKQLATRVANSSARAPIVTGQANVKPPAPNKPVAAAASPAKPADRALDLLAPY